MFRATLTKPAFQNIRLIVRILPPLLQNHLFSWKNVGFEANLTTHWTTHQEARQRTRRRSMCKHARAWTCRKAKAIGQKCEKLWENQGFAVERTGTELFYVFLMFFHSPWKPVPRLHSGVLSLSTCYLPTSNTTRNYR